MFKINGNPILETDIKVIETLREHLALNGIERFRQIKAGGNNIQVTCPIHSNGQERRPSCGISTIPSDGTPAGTVHCFTCGYTATLEEMVSHCFGYDDMGTFGRDWIVKNFLSISVEDRPILKLDFNRLLDETHSPTEFISETELDSYRYLHPYMYQRKLTDTVIETFDVGFDKDFTLSGKKIPCLTFPVRDTTGNTLFVARRSVNTKLFHYPMGVLKPVYGLYELPKDANEVIICESIINALTCYVYGRPAVALLGLGTKEQYAQLNRLNVRKFILAFDGDGAGQRATQRVAKALSSKIVAWYQLPDGKDINDLSQEEFENLAEKIYFL